MADNEIYRRGFASLIADNEYEDMIFCRVLVDGYFCCSFAAENRTKAIEIFNKFLEENEKVET